MSNQSGPGRYRRAGRPVQAEAVARMGFQQKEILVTFLLRKPEVFREAFRPGDGERDHVLMPEDFSDGYEAGYACLWRCAIDYYKSHQTMISKTALEAEADARLRGRPEIVPEMYRETMSIASWVFGVDPADLDLGYGLSLLQSFVYERTVADPMRRFWKSCGDSVPKDMAPLLDDFAARISRIRQVTKDRKTGIFDFDDEDDRGDLRPFNFAPMDVVMGGGRAHGELVYLYGPTGGGKTRLACKLAGEAAVQESLRAMMTGEDPLNVLFFTYETERYDVQNRILSYLARVTKSRLQKRPWADHLTSTRLGRQLLPYEMKAMVQSFRAPADTPAGARPAMIGELERVDLVRPLIEANLHVFDMRGVDDARCGSGGLDEIVSLVSGSIQKFGRGVTLVVCDYLQTICERYVESHKRYGDPAFILREQLEKFGDGFRRRVCGAFNCSGLVTVQLNGESNDRSPSSRPSHVNAKGCKTTATNVDFTYQLSTKDEHHQAVSFWTGKTRRGKAGDDSSCVLKFVDEYEDLIPSETLVLFDHEIRDKSDARGVSGVGLSRPRGTRQRPNPNAGYNDT